MFGNFKRDSRDLLLAGVLSIDIFYRVEWFHLHTVLSGFLAPIFGGEH